MILEIKISLLSDSLVEVASDTSKFQANTDALNELNWGQIFQTLFNIFKRQFETEPK